MNRRNWLKLASLLTLGLVKLPGAKVDPPTAVKGVTKRITVVTDCWANDGTLTVATADFMVVDGLFHAG